MALPVYRPTRQLQIIPQPAIHMTHCRAIRPPNDRFPMIRRQNRDRIVRYRIHQRRQLLVQQLPRQIVLALPTTRVRRLIQLAGPMHLEQMQHREPWFLHLPACQPFQYRLTLRRIHRRLIRTMFINVEAAIQTVSRDHRPRQKRISIVPPLLEQFPQSRQIPRKRTPPHILQAVHKRILPRKYTPKTHRRCARRADHLLKTRPLRAQLRPALQMIAAPRRAPVRPQTIHHHQ